VAVVDDDGVVRRDIQGEKGAEAVDHQLPFARRFRRNMKKGSGRCVLLVYGERFYSYKYTITKGIICTV